MTFIKLLHWHQAKAWRTSRPTWRTRDSSWEACLARPSTGELSAPQGGLQASWAQPLPSSATFPVTPIRCLFHQRLLVRSSFWRPSHVWHIL